MRRVLIFGSPDWDDTRAISHLFMDLRTNRDILYCDPSSGAGKIAIEMGYDVGFKVYDYLAKPEQSDAAYGFYVAPEGLTGATYAFPAVIAKTVTYTLSRRRQPERTPAQPAPTGRTPEPARGDPQLTQWHSGAPL